MKKDEKKLVEMFPQLKGGAIIERTTQISYNYGGTDHWYVWKVDGKFYKTYYNSWCIDSIYTTCVQVRKTVKTVIEWTDR